MKIVTYNVNSLRQRVSQFGSLPRLLHSLHADIVCFQETKLSRQELAADLTTAEGYEAFFSCTRTSDKGRIRYSGVATFCRVNSAFSTTEAALPLAAEEGFTGLLYSSRKEDAISGFFPLEIDLEMEGREKISREELLKVDSEGRCIITDHGHFVLFNLYGPRAEPDDKERIRFKLIFFKVLQKRWEGLLSQGKRVIVVGDLNIAPSSVDRASATPDFEENVFRKWLRSLLVENGGTFVDAFREKHPLRRDAYTCWSANTGAEEFNHGSRIDHILIGGPCLHEICEADHCLLNCHVRECDILTQFMRCKQDGLPRWKGGRTVKLEGSDHVPVFICLEGIPDVPVHSVPSLAVRYVPEVRGRQQTIVSLLMKKANGAKVQGESSSVCGEALTLESCCEDVKGPTQGNGIIVERDEVSFASQVTRDHHIATANNKRTKHGRSSQLTLTSFFQKNLQSASVTFDVSAEADTFKENSVFPKFSERANSSCEGILQKNLSSASVVFDVSAEADTLEVNSMSSKFSEGASSACEDILEDNEVDVNHSSQDNLNVKPGCHCENEKVNVATVEWQRIRQLMQKSLPFCVGHGEPCVARFVKKAGPNMGRGFYVCARAEGPKSNPEARCNHFQWASSKFSRKRR